jgi:hypothetical protein
MEEMPDFPIFKVPVLLFWLLKYSGPDIVQSIFYKRKRKEINFNYLIYLRNKTITNQIILLRMHHIVAQPFVEDTQEAIANLEIESAP